MGKKRERLRTMQKQLNGPPQNAAAVQLSHLSKRLSKRVSLAEYPRGGQK